MNPKSPDFKEFSKIKLYYISALQQLENELNIINAEFNTLNNINPISYTKTRLKSVSSIIDKLKRRNMKISIENTFNLHDIVGARIVCNFIDDIYTVVDKIKSNKKIKIIEEKDYIKNPKSSGYRGYHIIISDLISVNGIEKEVKSEIQVRTSAMDFWATSEHRLNYKKIEVDNDVQKELKKIANDMWHIDLSMNKMAKRMSTNELVMSGTEQGLSTKIIKEIISWRNNNEVFE